jgi:sterol 3beta-glucosyltransferase
MTGDWFLDDAPQDWRLDPALAEFLEGGGPPIYIGFGSMTTADPAQLAREVVAGAVRAGVRAILATGWGGLAEMAVPDSVHVIEEAPHAALFRHVAAVVHHGGAGTTAAGLRAGLPTLICPLAVDQPFWGRRLRALGCGPEPQPLKRLRADRFADGLRDLTANPSYRQRAGAIADAIAGEDGLGRAVAVVEAARR